jgi:uncharacterized Fe-S cluster-containing radical SAM superfamily protein
MTVFKMIDDVDLADRFRTRLTRGDKFLIANLNASREAEDKYTVVNCGGYGRVRAFRDYKLYLETVAFPDCPPRPNFRGYPPSAIVRSQVFQLSACNWRCWYCFVDDDRLSAAPRTSTYLSAHELLDLYMAEADCPDIIDLSGGQPDLVPEWTLAVVEECGRRGLLKQIHFWVDDNLSNDFLFRYLSRDQLSRLAGVPTLSRMGCFKGFDEESFTFTTLAPAERFQGQFELAGKIIDAGFRFYGYVTFTTPTTTQLEMRMRQFVDRLQAVHERLPLVTTPLAIKRFSAMIPRLDDDRARSLNHQILAFLIWHEELKRRFPSEYPRLRPDQISLSR